MNWIDINEQVPGPAQPITAQIEYMGRKHEISGARSRSEEKVVLFDFYSGTAGETIIKWKPRKLPMKKDAHPWCGIINKGI